jgi:hypothetical protein
MTQSLATMDIDEIDERTQPYPHSKIDRLREVASSAGPRREPRVCLERFFEFGNSGTPPGMIASENATSLLIFGWCGESFDDDAPRRDPAPVSGPQAELGAWGSSPSPAANDEVEDVPLSRADDLEWAPTKVHQAAAPEVIEDEAPTAELELPRDEPPPPRPGPRDPPAEAQGEPQMEAEAEPEQILDDDLRRAGIGRRRWLRLGVGVFLLAAGLTVTLILRGSDESATEPEPAVHIATKEVPPPAGRSSEPGDAVAETGAELDAEDQPPPEATELSTADSDRSRPNARTGETKKTKRKHQRRAHMTSKCEQIRDDADLAAAGGGWKQLEKLTRDYKCWPNSNTAKIMRMNALFELRRFEECVKVGEGSSNSKINKLRKRCSIAH